jgi:hypothetical protein
VDGVLLVSMMIASQRLFTTIRFGIVAVQRKAVAGMSLSSTREENAREIEEHIRVLADYDVIPFDVAETLTEYVWKILTGGMNVDMGNVSELKAYWDKLTQEEEEGRGGVGD